MIAGISDRKGSGGSRKPPSSINSDQSPRAAVVKPTPVTEDKSKPTKSAKSTKPVATKPVATKPVATKPVATKSAASTTKEVTRKPIAGGGIEVVNKSASGTRKTASGAGKTAGGAGRLGFRGKKREPSPEAEPILPSPEPIKPVSD